jgi:3',5'-nucleoside bisphosphate phosphatase
MNESEKKADLHLHSYYSDGTLAPSALVDMAQSAGHIGLSITDHDTLEGYEEAKKRATEKGVFLVSGIEISSQYDTESIHVLGYAFDPDNTEIRRNCLLHHERRECRIIAILERLAKLGMSITLEEVHATSKESISYGRPHIALAMVEKGYVPSVLAAFSQYLKSGRPCYVEGQKWTIEEAVAMIHAAHGFAVLAHPQLIKLRSQISHILSLGFDGIEAFYDSLKLAEQEPYVRLAEKKGLLVTGGSDFHGLVAPNRHFGASWTPYETFKIFHERMQRASPS